MKKLLKIFEKHFSFFFLIASLLGLFSSVGESFEFLIIPLLALILFFTFLKLDISEVIVHIKSPIFLLYVAIMFLLIIPSAIFLVTYFLLPEYALPVLLITAVPVGLATPVFSDICKVNVSLSVALVIVTHLLAPFTIPLIFSVFTFSGISVNALEIFKLLLILIVLPLVASQIVRKKFVQKIQEGEIYFSGINVAILAVEFFIIFSLQRSYIFENIQKVIFETGILYILFLLLHILGYSAALWRSREDKITLSISKAYMNNALAIGLAISFFRPEVVFVVVLSEIPWMTLIGLFQKFQNSLKKNNAQMK